ncbi:MAG: thioredoxin family protein [Chitinophagaceae bacterium]|nr:thioredoxin family protein [Chitinophagaceae bacterium]
MKKLFASIIAVCSIAIASQAQSGYKVGDLVQDFQLKNIDGKITSLHSIPDAKGYVVIFTCNHCPYAKAYEDRIIELHNRFAPQGYPVVAINPNDPNVAPDDSYEKMKERAQEKGFPFLYVYDETQNVAKQYGALKTPHVFLVQNVAGKKVVQYIGAIDNNWEDAAAADKHFVADAINSLKEGNKIAVTETKAIGCGVKWKK